MKKIQRILMALAICSLSVVAVGCSSKNNNDNNTTNENSKDKNAGKLTNEELVKKVSEATKAMKSSKAKVVNNVTVDMAGRKTNTSVDMDMTMTLDPLVIKMSGKMSALGKSSDVEMYITSEAIYAKNSLTNAWMKISDETTKKALEKQKNATNLDGMVEMLDAIGKNLKVEEKDSGYEVAYSGTDDTVKEVLKKIMSASQPNAAQLLNGMQIEKLDIRYIIDKKTFFPKEYEMATTVKMKQNDKEISFDMEIKANYSDINEVKEVTIPDEVKNAKEWKKN